MADSPPPGYSGGSTLAAPSQPIEMKVFQGGGSSGGDMSILPQPDQRLPMTEFRGGGKKERTDFQRGLETFKQTNYYKTVSSGKFPQRANVGIYIIDEQGRLCVFRRSDRKKTITAPGGGVDPQDIANFREHPTILAAIREAKEEVGVNLLNIRNFKLLKSSELENLKKEQANFIPIYNAGPKQGKGGLECFVFLLNRPITTMGPDAKHEIEVQTGYDYQPFGTDIKKIRRSPKGVAWIDINHLVDTLNDPKHKELKDPLYFKFFEILSAIQEGGTKEEMEAKIPKLPVATPGLAPKPPAKPANAESVDSENNDITVESENNDVTVESENNTGVTVESDDSNESEESAASIPPPPKKKDPLVFEKGKLVSGSLPSNLKNNITVTAGEEVEPAPEKVDVLTRKLSNGLVVRVLPEDDSLKADILSFKFTGDEEVLFNDVLHFKHPFIKKYLQKPEVQDEFYDFWKLYTTYDGTDQYTLMTNEEGRKIQKFMKQVLDAYREYLVGAALPFLLKQEKPELLELLKEPKDEEKFQLMETILVPTAPPKPEEPPTAPAPAPPTEPQTEEPEVEIVEGETKEDDEEPEEENNKDAARKTRIAELFRDLNLLLEKPIPRTGRLKLAAINLRVRSIIELLTARIPNKKEYLANWSDGPTIGAMSIPGDGTHILPADKVLTTRQDENGSITEFLRKLVRIDLTQINKPIKEQFYDFFDERILKDAAKQKFSEYIHPKKASP